MKRVLTIQSRKNFNLSQVNSSVHLTYTIGSKMKKSKSSEELYVPNVPFFCPVTKKIRDNERIRDILVFDENQEVKPPRFSW